jgi:imidazolonepropionase-like amidohydrolase
MDHRTFSPMKRLLYILLALASLQTATSQTKYSLLITNANIVDVVSGKVIKNQLIAISGDTIKAIDNTKAAAKYSAVKQVDAQGKYVMPGLWDMHIHLRGGDSTIEANKALLPLFLVYGVTTVRECGGDITPSVMEWRKQAAAGELASPRIFTAGPKLDGPHGVWAGSIPVVTPEDVTKALDSLKKIHVDFVKIYDSKISGAAYLEIVRQAKSRGMLVTGHMPYSVELKEAAALGMNGSEHLYYVFKSCSSKEDSITEVIRKSESTPRPIGLFQALPTLYNTYDAKKADQLFKFLASKHFSITPTLYISKTLGSIKTTDHTNDSLQQYIDPKIIATYQGRVRSAKRASDESTSFRERYDSLVTSMVPKMYTAGVNIVAGSDCGASNSYVYPGQSIHEEIKLLVQSGLTPAQSLTTATINGSKFFGAGVQSFFGSLKPGKCSDLIILDANPLENIAAIDQINTVLSHGKVYTKQDLNNLLASIKHK